MDPAATRLYSQAGSVSVWHPDNLDVDALVESCGQRVAEGVLWLGHCVFTGLADDARCRDTGRVPLMAEYLYRIIGRHHVAAVRQAARDVGYVDRDCSYRPGHHSQTHWILSPYDRAPVVRREIANSRLRHNVRAWKMERRRGTWQRIEQNETPVDAAVCVHLWRNLQRIRIAAEIDFGADYQPAHQVAVERIREADLWFKVDDFGRVHTNLTNLPSNLRQHLAVDREPLANVDISESQPLFMGMAIARSCERASDRPTTDGNRTKTGRGKANGRLGVSLHMFDNTMFDKDSLFGGRFDRGRLPEDLRRYLDLCEARGLYQTVADRLGRTRDEAKKAVMVVFFDKPWHRNRLSAALDEMFPSVIEVMRKVKQQDHRRLAHWAQRIESEFMFGRVVPRIMAERPDLFVATIHDSILTTNRSGRSAMKIGRAHV